MAGQAAEDCEVQELYCLLLGGGTNSSDNT